MASKVVKGKGKVITPLEEKIGAALTELQATKELADLATLTIAAAKEIEVAGGKKAVVVFVPFRQHKKFQKIQGRLIRELEKKFSGSHFVIVAQRTVLSPEACKVKGVERPRSRTLTSVHAAILDDIAFPSAIVGKRTRVRQDSSKLLKIYLDPKDAKDTEDKLKTFSAVYTRLTRTPVEFLFPTEN